MNKEKKLSICLHKETMHSLLQRYALLQKYYEIVHIPKIKSLLSIVTGKNFFYKNFSFNYFDQNPIKYVLQCQSYFGQS